MAYCSDNSVWIQAQQKLCPDALKVWPKLKKNVCFTSCVERITSMGLYNMMNFFNYNFFIAVF